MIDVRPFVSLALLALLVATTMPTPACASPARRLARQGVVVVPVPSAAPAPPLVVPLPGASPVVASRPLRPWRKTLVQPVALVVPVPVAPLVVGPTVAVPAAPPAFAPQPAVPQSPTPAPVEVIPAPRAAGGGEPELRFAAP